MMNREQLSNLLLHYGRVVTDEEYSKIDDNGYIHNYRTRIFMYNCRAFYHQMINGKVVKCFSLT